MNLIRGKSTVRRMKRYGTGGVPNSTDGIGGLTRLSEVRFIGRRCQHRKKLRVHQASVAKARARPVNYAKAAWLRGRSVQRREVYGQAMWTAVPGMAHLPA